MTWTNSNRVAKCAVCGIVEQEESMNSGWKGWSIIEGVSPTFDDDSMLLYMCKKHTVKIAELISIMQRAENGVD